MSVVIKVENLTKTYQLGVIGQTTLQEALSRQWSKFIRRTKPITDLLSSKDNDWRQGDTIYALQNLNFEVKKGEVLGIIGKNGAGKSTLLKILSKITAPTSGNVKIKGRIASLLEVGTGMHPELTGRENIFLNGAILGMQRAEIRSKLDAIIDFAGIDDYIDTPIKRYSSGMRVRLGFAVAAFLEPEILIVDEVLAVGDAEFQKKAIGKMQDVAQGEGRTVLFVSHNMQAVSTLTSKAILMDKGIIVKMGCTQDIIDLYSALSTSKELTYNFTAKKDVPFIKKVKLITTYKNNIQESGKLFEVQLDIFTPFEIKGLRIGVLLVDKSNNGLSYLLLDNPELIFGINISKGQHRISCKVPTLRLYKGKYSISIYFSEYYGGKRFELLEGICPFEVVLHERKDKNNWIPELFKYFEDTNWEISTLADNDQISSRLYSYKHHLGFFEN